MRITRPIRIAQELLKLPQVEVRVWGDGTAREAYLACTRRHPRYRIIQHKRWGVGLLWLDQRFEEYLAGAEKSYLRRKRRQALARGYRFARLEPMERLEEMLVINASKESRQGKPISPDYLDATRLAEYLRGKHHFYGVYDVRGMLRAYACLILLGEAFSFDRLLGHADDLESGVMYLLVSEVIREMIAVRAEQGTPHWAMYDTFLGAHPGLRYFKERVGFAPYKVRWVWVPEMSRPQR